MESAFFTNRSPVYYLDHLFYSALKSKANLRQKSLNQHPNKAFLLITAKTFNGHFPEFTFSIFKTFLESSADHKIVFIAEVHFFFFLRVHGYKGS